MKTLINGIVRVMVVGLCVSAAPPAALAQEAAASDQSEQGTSNQTPQGGLIVERVQNGFVVAPDFKFTSVNGDFANLAGAYGGWLNDKTLLIGAGGYWLTNRSRDFKMAYGGMVVSWLTRTDRRIGFDVRGLIGGGSATVSVRLDDFFSLPDNHGQLESVSEFRPPVPIHRQDVIADKRFIVNEGFFIAEPQVDLLVKLTDRFRLAWGVGYRLIGGARDVQDRLRGASGSVALQIGGGF